MRRVVVVLDVEGPEGGSFRARTLRLILDTLLSKESRKWDYRFKVVSVSRIDEQA